MQIKSRSMECENCIGRGCGILVFASCNKNHLIGAVCSKALSTPPPFISRRLTVRDLHSQVDADSSEIPYPPSHPYGRPGKMVTAVLQGRQLTRRGYPACGIHPDRRYLMLEIPLSLGSGHSNWRGVMIGFANGTWSWCACFDISPSACPIAVVLTGKHDT